MLPELVARGAVEEEVDGMICVHEEFGDGGHEFKPRHAVVDGSQLLCRHLQRERIEVIVSNMCLTLARRKPIVSLPITCSKCCCFVLLVTRYAVLPK